MTYNLPPNYEPMPPDPLYSAVETVNGLQDVARDYTLGEQAADQQQRALDAESRRRMEQTNQR